MVLEVWVRVPGSGVAPGDSSTKGGNGRWPGMQAGGLQTATPKGEMRGGMAWHAGGRPADSNTKGGNEEMRGGLACRRAEAHAVWAGRDLAGQAVPLVPLLDPPRVVPPRPRLHSLTAHPASSLSAS